jgi:hypothetical protein
MLRRQLLVAGLLLLLAACGGGGTAPTTSAPGPTAAEAPTTAATATGPSATRTASVGPVIPPVTGTITTRTAVAGTPAAGSGTPRPLPSASPVAFAPAPWKPGDRTTYNVTTPDGQDAGTATFTIGGEFEAATLSANLMVGATQDRYQVGFDGKTFAPVSELRSIVTAQGTIDIRSEFHPGGATIEVIDHNGTVHNQLTLPDTYYINDQFLTILRALPFAQGYQGSLQIVPSQGDPATLAAVVTVTGQEDVTTPAGTITAWRVEADFESGNTTQVIWYSVEDPHYMVKYDTGRYVYLLTQKP